MTGLLVKLLVAYGLGSLSGSLLLGMLRHVDIRTLGSGNAGGTNALRTQGWWFALGVVLIDVGKGALAAAGVPLLPWSHGAYPDLWVQLGCGLAAILGHCYPVWHGFRGGKGAATSIGTLAVVQPILLVPMLTTWVVVMVLSGYVSLSTVLAALSLVPAAVWLDSPPEMLGFVSLLAAFIAFTHRTNFRRLREGRENRFERARLFRRR